MKISDAKARELKSLLQFASSLPLTSVDIPGSAFYIKLNVWVGHIHNLLANRDASKGDDPQLDISATWANDILKTLDGVGVAMPHATGEQNARLLWWRQWLWDCVNSNGRVEEEKTAMRINNVEVRELKGVLDTTIERTKNMSSKSALDDSAALECWSRHLGSRLCEATIDIYGSWVCELFAALKSARDRLSNSFQGPTGVERELLNKWVERLREFHAANGPQQNKTDKNSKGTITMSELPAIDYGGVLAKIGKMFSEFNSLEKTSTNMAKELETFQSISREIGKLVGALSLAENGVRGDRAQAKKESDKFISDLNLLDNLNTKTANKIAESAARLEKTESSLSAMAFVANQFNGKLSEVSNKLASIVEALTRPVPPPPQTAPDPGPAEDGRARKDGPAILLSLVAVCSLGLFFGFGAGVTWTGELKAERQKAHSAGVGRWEADPATGKPEFVYGIK